MPCILTEHGLLYAPTISRAEGSSAEASIHAPLLLDGFGLANVDTMNSSPASIWGHVAVADGNGKASIAVVPKTMTKLENRGSNSQQRLDLVFREGVSPARGRGRGPFSFFV